MALTNKLTAIADAIRSKTGGTEALTLDGMAEAVENLSTGSREDLLAARFNGTLTEYASDEVTDFPKYAFFELGTLTSVSAPNVTTVERYAFTDCTNLVDVNIPNAKTLNYFSVSGCSSLKSVDFPKVTTIGMSGFASGVFNASGIKVARFASIKNIYGDAFWNCESLTALVIKQADSVCSLARKDAFGNTPIANGTGYVYVPDALVEDYKAATNWATYAAQIKPLSEYVEVTE